MEAALAEKADLHLVDSLIRDIKGKLDKSEAASFYYEMGGSSQGPGYID